MLRGKDGHRLVKGLDVVPALVFRAFALVMQNGAVGQIVIAVACQENPVGEVDVLAIHEEGFVKAANFLKNRAAHEHPGAAVHIHIARFLGGQVARVVGAKSRVLGEEFG